MNNPLHTTDDARRALISILPSMASDGGLEHTGSERRYQLHVAMLLTKLNNLLPHQLEVEARMLIQHPITNNFKQLSGGDDYSERIVDIVLLSNKFTGHYSRENMPTMIEQMKMLIEIKSVAFGSRISKRSIVEDIDKLVAVREELAHKGSNGVVPVVFVFDTTRIDNHRIKPAQTAEIIGTAEEQDVELCIFTQKGMISTNGLQIQ